MWPKERERERELKTNKRAVAVLSFPLRANWNCLQANAWNWNTGKSLPSKIEREREGESSPSRSHRKCVKSVLSLFRHPSFFCPSIPIPIPSQLRFMTVQNKFSLARMRRPARTHIQMRSAISALRSSLFFLPNKQ